jgi:N-acetyl-gamma-glutamyl-phosphate reductase
MQHVIGLLGGSGYTGVELTRLLDGHPGVELGFVSSDRWVGDPVDRHVVGLAGPASRLRYVAPDRVLEQASRCAVVLLATPAEVSHELVPRILATGARVIDLSGAFRLRDPAAYATAYGFAHAHAGLLAEAVYGLPELFRTAIRGARLVANPGCYATAIQLALAPLVGPGVLAPGRLVVDAASGVTGAGRKATEDMSFAEVAGDFRAYRVLRHQHAPEIEQGLTDVAHHAVGVTFVPHLLPIQRGILATCHGQLAPGVAPATIAAAFEGAYGREPFVSLAAEPEAVTLHAVVGTNQCRIGFTTGAAGELVVIAAIDNLVKGAAGQAVQNLNLVLGLDETAGLTGLRSFQP